MIEQISPEKTVAFVVGIEKYDLASDCNLDGAANDALAFAQWLLDQGVKKEKILLFLSPLDKNRICCDGFGIPYEPATRDNVLNGLEHKLNSDANLEGDLLFLFWGGHGVADLDRIRLLLFANATAGHKPVVDFDSVLKTLRDKKRRTFEYQIGIVDSCANYIDGRLSIAKTSVSGEGPNAKIKQFVMFASSIGERAEHDQDRRTGLFSSEVLGRLKQHKPAPQTIWPNLNRLRDELKTHFERLGREGRLMFNQTPASFEWQWPDGEGGLIGAAIDSQTVLRYEQAKRIHSKIIKLTKCTTKAFDDAYRLTIRHRLRDKLVAEGLIEQIEQLALLPPRNKNEIPPLFEFAVRLNEFSDENELIDLVETELGQAKMPLAQLNNLREKLKSERALGVGMARGTRYILFDIGSDQIEYWHYRGNRFERHDWLRREGVPLANLISEHINQIESDPAMGEEIFLEFFITFDEGGDRHDFDQWEHSLSYLGCCYPVVVRWRERTLSRKAVKQNIWIQKILSIKYREVLCQPPTIFWLPANEYTSARLMPHLTESEDYDCVGFAISPVGAEVAEERRRMLRAVLLGGVPFAFWPRKDPHDQDQMKSGFDVRVSVGCKYISQLPKHMRLLREEPTGQEPHFCSGITLLWDDPDRNPVNCEDLQLEPPE
jgi:vWA-MoxR associated protein C-terminal domain/Caspase domain